jgi:hypothetical protein
VRKGSGVFYHKILRLFLRRIFAGVAGGKQAAAGQRGGAKKYFENSHFPY